MEDILKREVSFQIINQTKRCKEITQRFLHVGRNDGKRRTTLERKKRILVTEVNGRAVSLDVPEWYIFPASSRAG